jgi:hypothetical protein
MDILAAHRDGLIEQLDLEVAALAGRSRDHAQRAVVLHHLFDHSRGNHLWALAEARRTLRIASGLARLGRRVNQWAWLGGSRDKAKAALEQLEEALCESDRCRTISAYRAYRISSSQALRDEAEASLDRIMLGLLDQCHSARRGGASLSPDERDELARLSEETADASVDHDRMRAAWEAIEATGLKRAARRLLGDKALARHAARDSRRGAFRVERYLRADRALPPSFRVNPAQHFYALVHLLRNRRRQQWREACDREPDAFELAA